MRVFFKRSTPLRDAALAILFFGLLVPTQIAVAGDCSYECNERGCTSAGSTVTGQGGCRTTSRKVCVDDPEKPGPVCTTTTTCDTITGACGDFGPLEM